ncbi:hypothetical protein RRG08_003871 [Elysia crispata]|uniref:Major facilitator superfamily (MFS) profile domain-containing protein n=1 Tax=Elysia crispata TaxID=231223 RepID=A0AAE1DF52_9GAST|nr:hypothetical protein RRG08_003871 [Elysia crispata]
MEEESFSDIGSTSPSSSTVQSLTGYNHPLKIYNLALCATLGGALFGYDTGIVNGAGLLIKQEYNLDDKWIEHIVSATVGAAAVFSLVAGLLADAIGRKSVVVLSAVVFTVGGVILGVANGPGMILAGRITVGAAIGIVSCVVPVYVAECSPANIRGSLVTLFQVFVTLGIWLSAVLSVAFHDVEYGWRYMLGLSAIPSILMYIFFLFLPESPRYLILIGSVDEAQKTLEWIRDSPDVKQELDEMVRAHEKDPGATGFNVYMKIAVTTKVRYTLFIGCMLHVFQQFCGINAVIYYSSNILKDVGFDTEYAIGLSVIPFTVNFLATFIGLCTVEAMSRRRCLVISYIGISLALLVMVAACLPEYMNPHTTNRIHEQNLNTSGHCLAKENCLYCVNEPMCGFCALRKRHHSIVNGSCVPVQKGVDGLSFAKAGRCARWPKTKLFLGGQQLLFSVGYCPMGSAWVAFVALMLFVLAFAPGAGPFPWTINAELYPLWSRGVATSLSTCTNWMCNYLVSNLFLSAKRELPMWSIYLGFLFVSLLSALFTAYLVPETSKRTLEQIGRGSNSESVSQKSTVTFRIPEVEEVQLDTESFKRSIPSKKSSSTVSFSSQVDKMSGSDL